MNTVKFGNRGTTVEQLQLALFRAGYYSSRIDGLFGNGTRQAVISFQSRNNLVPDGIAGAKTWRKLLPYLRGYQTYTVKSGDTLWSISQNFSTSLRAVLMANPTVNPQNLQAGTVVFVPLSFSLVPIDVTISSELNELICDGLVVRYPFINSSSIGKTVMGKNITSLKIGNGAQQVFYNASHHANEWITSLVLLKFIEDYAYAYSVGGEIFGTVAAELFSKCSLFVVPMVDADGVDLVTGVLDSGAYFNNAYAISQRYSSIPFPSGWKANISGVDLNLQYPANWERAKEIKFAQGYTTPAPRDFVGTSPLSEPESRAVYNFTLAHNFLLTLSYHSQGKLIYWKYLDFEPERSREIADYFGEVSGYLVEETPYASGFAGYKDWFIQNYDRPGYTIEVGIGSSPLPLSQFPEIYTDNLGILTGGMTQI